MRMRTEVGIVDTATSRRLGSACSLAASLRSADGLTSGAVAIVNETFVGGRGRASRRRSCWQDVSHWRAAGHDRRRRCGFEVFDAQRTGNAICLSPAGAAWDAGQTLFVRMTGDPAAAARIVQEAVASIDPLLPRTAVTTLTREASTALLPQRVAAMVTGVLGVAGLLLAAIGLYGLVLYGVTLRLREIGVRLALGASRGDVVRWFWLRACA